MGWFTRGRPRPTPPDPIGDICRVLAERPWEWSVGEAGGPGGRTPSLKHLSGVSISWRNGYSLSVWMAPDARTKMQGLDPEAARRIYEAVVTHMAARVSRPRVPYDAAAVALADAVLAGDRTAAYGLADMIIELAGGTPRSVNGEV